MSSGRDKIRLDALAVQRGLAETRARAQAVILGGGMRVDGAVVTKPSFKVSAQTAVELVTEPMPYVSRGGLKLKHALDRFAVDPLGLVALDVGASTGGFTDVLLEAGVRRVYAIDVGYGQLAWRLRNDQRVVVMERTNIRHLHSLPEAADLAVIDVSFISLTIVLPSVERQLKPTSDIVALIKPQFEAGRNRVGKGGVVRDPGVRRDVLKNVLRHAQERGWRVLGLERSPITGPAGNAEFLTHLSRGRDDPALDIDQKIATAAE